MKRLMLAMTAVSILVAGTVGLAAAQSAPEFRLGFKALADQVPDVVGQPLENEHWGANGDSLQQTSNGLMAWRKADNWTAFTNGAMTWINGPAGVQSRPNDQRFDWEEDQSSREVHGDDILATAIKVIDGNTIDAQIGGKTVRVRYIGISIPESTDPRRPVEVMGEEALKKNRALVEGQQLFLEKDVSETDRHGQLLRYGYLADGRMINEELLRLGYAQVATYPPDVKYVQRFKAAEKEAKQAYRGLWGPVEMYGGPQPQQVGAPTPTPAGVAPSASSGACQCQSDQSGATGTR